MHPLRSFIAFVLCVTSVCAQEALTSQNDDRLREGLARFPDSDTNKDGILTLPEATAYLAKMRKPKAEPPPANARKPELANVSYGPHERNVLDFYRAKSDHPTPVVVFIHGGRLRAISPAAGSPDPAA